MAVILFGFQRGSSGIHAFFGDGSAALSFKFWISIHFKLRVSRSNRPSLKVNGHPGHPFSNPEGAPLKIEKTTRRPA